MARHINAAGLQLIKDSERFVSAPYLCPANVWTIGYGSTVLPTGELVSRTTKPIDINQANEYLQYGVLWCEQTVTRLVKPSIVLTDNQFSALCSLVYNIGSGNFQASTVRSRLNRGDYDGAAEAFGMWVKGRVNGKLVTLSGLVTRRAAETRMFLSE